VRKKYRCRKKKSSGLHITFRYLISLLPVCILVVLAYNLLSSKLFVPCANSISCQESLKLKIENNAMGIFNNHKIIPPKVALSLKDAKPAVLGKETALGEKHIYINLTRQRLYAYQGKTLFMETSVATGRWGRTPLGVFKIGLKVLSTRMTGGSGADFYDLPNVTYVMFFYNDKIPLSR